MRQHCARALLLLLVPLFFLQLIVIPPFSVSGSGDVDLVLYKLKPALQGQGTTANAELATWNASTPLCLWRGLRWSTAAGVPLHCDTPDARAKLTTDSVLLQLVSIRLPAAALGGRLPPELGALSALESVYLAANALQGPIPLELGNAPALSHVDLAANALSGPVPRSIWNLCDRLADLRLHGNALDGAIPPPAGPNTTCDRLRVLDLGANRFSGDFPSFLASFRGLRQLDLGANRLSGPVPAAMAGVQTLNLSYNNLSGQIPPGFRYAESFLGNGPALCGAPLPQACVASSGLSSGGVAGVVIGVMAGAVVLASVSIGWAQLGRKRSEAGEEDEEEGEEGGGKLVVFEGGSHLTLEEVLNATGQVVEKGSYCSVYKARLPGGGAIQLRLLREGACAEPCAAAVRRIGRVRHENLVPLRAFYHGRRGEKLLVYDDYPPHRTLHDLLHGDSSSSTTTLTLTWPRRHKIALGAARALAYLHQEEAAAHGNVRASNVVLDEALLPRLAEHGVVSTLLLTPKAAADGYMAPELKTKRSSCCGARTDVYAFGILLLELLTGRRPAADLPALVKAAVLEEATMEVFDPEVARGLREDGLLQALKLAMGCCAPVPAARPTMTEVVRQLQDNRPKPSSALHSPAADTTSGAATPANAA